MISDNNIMAQVHLPLRFLNEKEDEKKTRMFISYRGPPSEPELPGLNIINPIEHLHNWIDWSENHSV